MGKLVELWRSPYPTFYQRWKAVVIPSAIIFLILYILQPFGISRIKGSVFGVVAGSALIAAGAGFILSFKKLKEHSNLETACYVGMGACILVAMKPLLDHLGELGATTAFWWLIGGGVSYIVGAVFYSLRKPYMHATFHLFCLGGSIGHIIAIWLIL